MQTNNRGSFPVIFAVPNADTLCEPVFTRLKQSVSVERRNRAERFHRREDACRSIIAEALAKYTLKSTKLINCNEITFETNQYGKPVSCIDGVHFNISHSGCWVVCAADTSEIGIDIEKIHKIETGIAERFFTETEIKLLSQCSSESEWMDIFFRLWVLKESYIKAIGMGLSCSLNSFSVLPEQDNAELICHDNSLAVKFFKVYNVDKDYKCAICCSNNKFPEMVNIIPAEKLIMAD